MNDSSRYPGKVLAGYIQHPITGYWQVWASLEDGEYKWVSAFITPDQAEYDVQLIQNTNNIENLELQFHEALSQIQALNAKSEYECEPLPGETGISLYKHIRSLWRQS